MGEAWSDIKLGEVGTWYGGSTPSKARPDFWTDGAIPWVSPKDMKSLRIADSEDRITHLALEERNQAIVPTGSVLVVIRSGILSRTLPVATTSAPVTINQDLKALEPKNGVGSEFTAWFLRSAERRILDECAKDGTTVASVNLDALKSVRMPLPSLVEQRAIVAKIESLFSELDQGVAQLEAVRAQLGRYRQSVLKAAFEGRLTAAWRDERRREAEANGEPLPTADDLLARIRAEREAAHAARLAEWERAVAAWEDAGGKASGTKKPRKPAAPKDPPPLTKEELADLPELPEGWVWCRLGHGCELDVGFAFKSADFSDQGIRLLRGENIEPGQARWNDTRYWPTTKLKGFEHLLLNPGDIVLAMDRPVVSAGFKIARLRPTDVPALLVQRVARFRPANDVEAGYIYWNVNTDRSIRSLVGTQTGTQLPHISGGAIQSLPIALCSPDEQTEIVNEIDARLSVVDSVERTIAAALKQAEALRQSILKKAFEGRLLSETELAAVRADPAYEPADQLLARIRETNAAAAPKKKTRRKRKPAEASP